MICESRLRSIISELILCFRFSSAQSISACGSWAEEALTKYQAERAKSGKEVDSLLSVTKNDTEVEAIRAGKLDMRDELCKFNDAWKKSG